MRGELGLYLAGGSERGLIQRVEILAHSTGRIGRIDARNIPFFLRCGVLFVGISFDQAGINRHPLAAGRWPLAAGRWPLAADQPFFDAPRNRRLEEVAEQFAVTETAMAVLLKVGVIRYTVGQLEATEPAIGQVQMHLFAQPPL